ncbi:MAG: VCBS repeat-containing protein [Chitinophagales bacterium]
MSAIGIFPGNKNLLSQETLFTLMPSSATNIHFNNALTEDQTMNVITYQYLYNGGGVAIGDINNDGLPDIFFSGNMVGDKLYLNKGDLKFEDITEKAGFPKKTNWSTGVTMADVNADGFLDIYVSKSGRFSTHDRHNSLFINNGDNTFTERAREFGVDDSSFTTQSVFFDFDVDGDLDLFTLNHAVSQTKGFILSGLRTERDKYAGNKLFRNDNGYFNDISAQAGINGSAINFGLGIMVGDINNDRYPDIFVTNDYNEQDFLYLNNKNGTFTQIIETAFGHTSNFSMGCDMADINNDGWLDLFVADMLPEDNYRQKILKGPSKYDSYQLSVDYGFFYQQMRNTLQINNGNNTFSEIANYAGVAATDWSWAPLFADFDNDGFKDLFITNGYRRDFTDLDFMKYTFGDAEKKAFDEGTKINSLDMVQQMPSVKIANYIFKGNETLQFENKITDWGFGQPSFSNGAAYGDLDLDGDLDIVVNNINDEAFVYRNNRKQDAGNNFIKVKLIGEGKNTFATGARVTVSSGEKLWMQELMPARGYESSVEPILHFGIGDADEVKVNVDFQSGKSIVYEHVKADIMLIVEEKLAATVYLDAAVSPKLFNDITSTILNYSHQEEDYIDFKREPLMPYKLSQQGPKMTTGDVNGDGLEDVFIGGAKNKKGRLFIADMSGNFFPVFNGPWEKDSAFEDIDVLFFDADNDHDNDLYVVSGGNEYIENSRFYQDRLYINNGKGMFKSSLSALPVNYTSKSCVKACDLDDDGDLDLFVGGKLIPGKYPLAPQSFIFRNDFGVFTDITSEVCPELLSAGMVNDAVWADINNDNKQDLIIAGDWMPVTIFLNKKGSLKNITGESGLLNSSGWWNCIDTADIDQDGDIDLIAGNRGSNAQIKATINKPATLYAYDFDHNGSIDPVLCYYFNDGKSYPVASKDDMLDEIALLKKKYVYYKDYAGATIHDMFEGEDFASIPVLKAEIFESAVLLNEGKNTFSIRKLPSDAQWFPINCTIISDFNKDGNVDLLIAGNNNSIRPEFGKIDSGFGLMLAGDGKGNFNAIKNADSGINIPGEVKDMEMINFKGEKYILIVKNKMAAQVLLVNE